MATSAKAARFKRELAADLRSANNAIGVVQAVHAITTSKDALACLDLWCDAFDPADWPVERQKKEQPRFERARTAGYLLFLHAIALARPTNGLAEMVEAMPRLALAQTPAGEKEERHARYARRYAALDDKSRADIASRLKEHVDEQAGKASQKRLLTDSLAEAYRDQNGEPHRSLSDLFTVKFDELAKRHRFEQLAAACEQAWTTTTRRKPKEVAVEQMYSAFAKGDVVPMPDAVTTAGKVAAIERTFSAFAAWLTGDMKTPLDFFRLAAWVREASDEMRAQTWSPGEFRKSLGGTQWNNVWEELYLEVIARGQHLALSAWHIQPMRPFRAFVGQDAAFIARPLGPRGRELLWRRLKLAERNWQHFADFNLGRRRAYIVAQQNSVNLLDEIEQVASLKQAEASWKKDPVGAARRWIQGTVNRRAQNWWIHQTIDDAFTVLWIETGSNVRGKNAGHVLIDVHAVPGFVFRAYPPFSGLSKLHEDAFYRQVARNAEALAAGALALFQLMGYAFDFASAIAGGGGIRMILFRFVTELVADEAINAALDAAKIENPWVRMALTMGVNFIPKPKLVPPPVRAGYEIDFDAARKGQGAQAGTIGRVDAVTENEALKVRATEKPLLDRGASPLNRAMGGGRAVKSALPGPPEHFPFGGGGKPLPTPESPNKVYRIMSNDEAAKTLKNQRLPPPIRGAEGERFISLDSDYSMKFREKELADIEEKFGKQVESGEKSLKNIDDRLARLKAGEVPDLDAISKLNARREKLLAVQRERGLANKAEAERVIGNWHEAEGQQVVVEIELEPGALDDMLTRSIDYTDWGKYSGSGKDVFLWKLERGYGRNIGIPKWQLDAFNARIKNVRMHSYKQPLGKGKPGLANN